eukprot:TRINITY_DN26105_c0_g1_i1.p1 TRINITY_DN26105_c0_g1~~TRINITY_DN26105_c0_g1_i1.p1  ORF type:complete len:620 (+),score=122.84 TRINITY_DN26105_c0_g1_i1:43-1902(+)
MSAIGISGPGRPLASKGADQWQPTDLWQPMSSIRESMAYPLPPRLSSPRSVSSMNSRPVKTTGAFASPSGASGASKTYAYEQTTFNTSPITFQDQEVSFFGPATTSQSSSPTQAFQPPMFDRRMSAPAVAYTSNAAPAFNRRVSATAVSYANNEELEAELRESIMAQLKVKYFAAMAPALVSQLRNEDERLVQGVFGSWRYFATSTARDRAVQTFQQMDRAAESAKSASSRAAKHNVGSKVVEMARKSGRSLANMVAYFLFWRSQVKRGNIARRCMSRLAESSVASRCSVVLLAWRSAAHNLRTQKHRRDAFLQRRELRLQLCEARNELAGLTSEAEVAEANAADLAVSASKALAALGLAISGLNATARSADPQVAAGAEEAHEDTQPLPQETATAKAQTLHEAFESSLADLAGAWNGLTDFATTEAKDSLTLRSAAADLERLIREEEKRMQEVANLRSALETSALLRAECAELKERIASSLGAGAAAAAATSSSAVVGDSGVAAATVIPPLPAASEELTRARSRTSDLERRVADAEEWVVQLRDTHRRLLEEAAASSASLEAEEGGSELLRSLEADGLGASDSPLPEVQKAICELARVSEELLNTNVYPPLAGELSFR